MAARGCNQSIKQYGAAVSSLEAASVMAHFLLLVLSAFCTLQLCQKWMLENGLLAVDFGSAVCSGNPVPFRVPSLELRARTFFLAHFLGCRPACPARPASTPSAARNWRRPRTATTSEKSNPPRWSASRHTSCSTFWGRLRSSRSLAWFTILDVENRKRIHFLIGSKIWRDDSHTKFSCHGTLYHLATWNILTTSAFAKR